MILHHCKFRSKLLVRRAERRHRNSGLLCPLVVDMSCVRSCPMMQWCSDWPEVSKWSCRVLELVFSAAFSNARPKKLEGKEKCSFLIGVLAFFREEKGPNASLCLKAWTNSLFLVRGVWFWWNSQDDHSPLLHIQRSGHYQRQYLTALVPRLTKTHSWEQPCPLITCAELQHFSGFSSLMWLNSTDTSIDFFHWIFFAHMHLRSRRRLWADICRGVSEPEV